MTIENNQSALARAIPTPPGGGSWTFDETRWEWVSNDSASDEETAATQPAVVPEQPAAFIAEE